MRRILLMPNTWHVALLLLILGMVVLTLRCWFCWWFCCIIIPSMLNPFCNVELKECKLAVKLCILSMYFSSDFSSLSIILFFNWISSCPRANILFSVVVFFVSLKFFFSFSLEIKFLLASTLWLVASRKTHPLCVGVVVSDFKFVFV